MITRLMRLKKRLIDDMYWYDASCEDKTDELADRMQRKNVTFANTKDESKIKEKLSQLNAKMPNLADRIKHNDSMISIERNSGEVLSFAWITQRDKFWISEIGLSIKLKGRYLPYDSYTPAQFQRNGYYTLNMALACNEYRHTPGIFYVLKNNEPANRALMGLGFKHISPIPLILRGDFSRSR